MGRDNGPGWRDSKTCLFGDHIAEGWTPGNGIYRRVEREIIIVQRGTVGKHDYHRFLISFDLVRLKLSVAG